MNEPDGLTPQSEQVEPDVFRQFLDNQAQELLIRQQDQILKEQEIANAHEYSMKLLDAQLVDRQRERVNNKSALNTGGCFATILVLALVGGICYALYLNKDQIVMELIKAIIFVVSGGIGGYSIKAIKSKKDEPKE